MRNIPPAAGDKGLLGLRAKKPLDIRFVDLTPNIAR
jgi:hypothetical protein